MAGPTRFTSPKDNRTSCMSAPLIAQRGAFCACKKAASMDEGGSQENQAKNSLDSVIGSMYWPSLYTRMLPEAISSISIT